MIKNPFTYGNPITDPARFIGRRREVGQVHSRLLNAEFESSSIVGERRIGKTSLLKYLSHPRVTSAAGFASGGRTLSARYVFVYVDLQILDPTKTPTDFWQRVLRAIGRQVDQARPADTARPADPGRLNELWAWIDEMRRESSIDAFVLDDVFGLVDDLNLHIVLLLDEFERVTQNASFDLDFFSGLRSMAIHHNLALITSSRRELVELTHSKEVQDSPFFNIFANINLRLFTEQESQELISRYLPTTDLAFHPGDIDYARWLAGPHPYFLQMAFSTLYDAYQAHPGESETQARRRLLERELREEAAPAFSDYWYHSPNDQRTLLAILSHHRREQGEAGYTLQELSNLYVGAESTLAALEKRGLILASDAGALEARYRLLSPALSTWIEGEVSRPPQERIAEMEISAREPAAYAQLVQLRRVLVRQFDVSDLHTLCFDMNVDYEGLPGDGKGAKVRELLAFLERRGRIGELIGTIRQVRPDVDIDPSFGRSDDN
jgi:hypothetical protein